jgi:hypothetical protein
MLFLKEDTAVTIRVGPFLDRTNAYDAETGMSLTETDVRLSKNGAAFAQKATTSPITTLTHDENGWYSLDLNATDTDTAGSLVLAVHATATALPVFMEFMVVPTNIYNSLFANTDKLQVDVQE